MRNYVSVSSEDKEQRSSQTIVISFHVLLYEIRILWGYLIGGSTCLQKGMLISLLSHDKILFNYYQQ